VQVPGPGLGRCAMARNWLGTVCPLKGETHDGLDIPNGRGWVFLSVSSRVRRNSSKSGDIAYLAQSYDRDQCCFELAQSYDRDQNSFVWYGPVAGARVARRVP